MPSILVYSPYFCFDLSKFDMSRYGDVAISKLRSKKSDFLKLVFALRLRLSLILALSFSFLNYAFADDFSAGDSKNFYRPKKNETLGGILSSVGLCPLWGSGEMVDEVVRLNPKLKSRRGDLILPGDTIFLPSISQQDSFAGKINRSGEVNIEVWNLNCKNKVTAVEAPKTAPGPVSLLGLGSNLESSTQVEVSSTAPIFFSVSPRVYFQE